ncbi:AcpP Acyl carrier protein [uncultured Caudovirales phage]|uniref:AcpP Acyl carrier protein n=1 Tax=uncultured Caudovirales phage TaxID=2100421 RepID=A0A6J7WD64_9CAUD|nr:AcpP Acyl carrier protein [uncultured Caudovirales phage]CAB5208618.1 AcpP Acyl carrier protein [uncultured Caudovirales phage]
MTAVEDKVIKIITKELRMKDGIVKLTSKFVEELGTDSLDALEIIVALEDEFKIALPNTMHEQIITVQDAVNAVLEHKKG